MAVVRAIGAAALTMLVLYVAFDAGPVPAAPGTPAALLGLAALFGAGAWATSAAGRSERSPGLAGLAAGLACYAALQLWFG